jgi:acyl-CoA thioester hydrolase
MAREQPFSRENFRLFRQLQTRWSDNDVYGHMNNVVHYALFDTAVNGWLVEEGLLDPHRGGEVFLVVGTACSYFAEMAFPDRVSAGIRVAHLGNSSVRYEIALFRNDEKSASAQGHFVHVLVDRESRKPAAIAGRLRAILEGIAA